MKYAITDKVPFYKDDMIPLGIGFPKGQFPTVETRDNWEVRQYLNKDIIWLDNKFNLTLEIKSISRGASMTYIDFIRNGKYYSSMKSQDFNDFFMKSEIIHGKVSGNWQFKKSANQYSLVFVGK
jgi:hypothetical protein